MPKRVPPPKIRAGVLIFCPAPYDSLGSSLRLNKSVTKMPAKHPKPTPAVLPGRDLSPRQLRMHEIIFEADTPAGKFFDLVLIVAIVLSVCAVMLESVDDIATRFGGALAIMEWVFTVIFSVEYILRLCCVRKPSAYAFSFYGVVDLLAILPTYLALLIPGAQALTVVRIMRVLRVFRVLKLVNYMSEATVLASALRSSTRKITVFLITVLTIDLSVGAVMYLIEGPASGFTSIPRGVYWAIVTMTTVGYGNIAPVTVLGQMLASLLMIMGYGIIAVPTGIVSVELASSMKTVTTQACQICLKQGHDNDAKHCKFCGHVLNPQDHEDSAASGTKPAK